MDVIEATSLGMEIEIHFARTLRYGFDRRYRCNKCLDCGRARGYFVALSAERLLYPWRSFYHVYKRAPHSKSYTFDSGEKMEPKAGVLYEIHDCLCGENAWRIAPSSFKSFGGFLENFPFLRDGLLSFDMDAFDMGAYSDEELKT